MVGQHGGGVCGKDGLVVVGEWHGLLAHHTNTPMHWLCCGVAATLLKCCMGCVVFCVCCVAATLPTAMVLVSMCVCTSNSHLLCGNCSIDCVVVVVLRW